jgi:hypothetical protein
MDKRKIWRREKMAIKVGKLKGKRKKYIVYEDSIMKPISGIVGQSRSTAYRIRQKEIKKEA